jgi:hypothetical protein
MTSFLLYNCESIHAMLFMISLFVYSSGMFENTKVQWHILSLLQENYKYKKESLISTILYTIQVLFKHNSGT